MKANLRDIIYYIDGSTLEKAKNEKAQKQESSSKVSKDVEKVITKYCDEIFANGAETEVTVQGLTGLEKTDGVD